jgi:hypothetical protein
MITLQLNISLCIDLVLMIKYPFENKETRMNYYIFGSITVAFFFGIMNVMYLNTEESKKWPYIMYIAWFSLFLFLAAYSTIYAACKLMRPGISGQVRTLILKRHLLCILLFMVANIYILLVAITYTKNLNYQPSQHAEPW